MPASCRCFAERRFVHSGRAGADDHAGQTVLLDGVSESTSCPCFRAHILIIGGEDNARLRLHGLGDLLYVHRCGDIASAPAYKYADSLHCLLPYFLYLRIARHDRLLRKLCRRAFAGISSGVQMIAVLLADHRKTHRLDQLRGLNVARTSLHARKAAKGTYRSIWTASACRSRPCAPSQRTDADGIPSRHSSGSVPEHLPHCIHLRGFTPLIRRISSWRTFIRHAFPSSFLHAQRFGEQLGKILHRKPMLRRVLRPDCTCTAGTR